MMLATRSRTMPNSVGPVSTSSVAPSTAMTSTSSVIITTRSRSRERAGRCRSGRPACSEGYWLRRIFRLMTPSPANYGMDSKALRADPFHTS